MIYHMIINKKIAGDMGMWRKRCTNNSTRSFQSH